MRFSPHRACSSLKWYQVVVILVLAAFFILFSLKRKPPNMSKNDRGLFKFDSKTREIQVRNLKGELILQGVLGLKINPSYSAPEESTHNGLHYTWEDHVLLSITKAEKNCLLVDWDNVSEEPFIPMDCFSLGDSYWYGGGEINMASWPVSKASIDMAPFYPKLYSGAVKKKQHYTSVVEPYWLTSSGVAIYVDEIVPLHVSLNANNDGKICLKADTQGYPGHETPIHLKYKLCFGSNLKATHSYMTRFFDKPSGGLSSSLMHYPICSMKSPTQSDLEWHYKSLVTRHFPCGSIDLGLQHNFVFDKKTFPDPESLIETIQRGKRMNVMVGIDSSFIVDSKETNAVPKDFLAKGNGIKSINLANSKAVNWFLERMETFKKQYNINLLRFCCGEIEFPINHYSFEKSQNPGIIVHNYVKVAASVGANSDIKVGFRSQSYPLPIRIVDRNPEWGREMGLRSIISMVLSVGFVGYPFVIIGTIGGKSLHNTKPEKELYIRWMQLSIFFPIMEFKIYPWEYDDETIDISSDILETRSTIWDNILAITKLSAETGDPVVRPMWWIAPDDPKTYTINGQFMLGDLYLVAPVVWKGKTKHDVYLPKGVWREMFGKGTKHELEIGRWLTFNIELRTVVYFECLICKE